jgi:hypothetical protein
MKGAVILLTPFGGSTLERLKAIYAPAAREIFVATSLEALEAINPDDGTSLVGFGSGVVVPSRYLKRLRKPAYNLHAATPDFPGRDPHHHAAYAVVDQYGATLHIMTDQVDGGPIIAVKTFPVPEGVRPAELLRLANEAGLSLLETVGDDLLKPDPLPALAGVTWSGPARRRADFRRLCRVSPLMSESEFLRRFAAFDGGSHDNLTLTLHGWTFRIDKSEGRETEDPAFAEFTEDGYRSILKQLQGGGYRFVGFHDRAGGRQAMLRHDVDFSLHRAARLAEIEAEEGALATYFLNPRSEFYNLLEPGTARLLDRITAAGHEIGLHFAGEAHGVTNWSKEALENAVSHERRLLETIIGRLITAVSFHNPDLCNLLSFREETIAELVNAYSQRLFSDYTYVSDSNGYWRFKPIPKVIEEGHEKLYLLTHPAWWTPIPMSPSDRVDRCLLGRARAVRQTYDALLKLGGRKNVSGKSG